MDASVSYALKKAKTMVLTAEDEQEVYSALIVTANAVSHWAVAGKTISDYLVSICSSDRMGISDEMPMAARVVALAIGELRDLKRDDSYDPIITPDGFLS